MKIYVPARNLYIANEFCNRHNFEGLEIKITTGISSLFVYINDIINNENEPVLIMHDDTYFNKDFISRVNNAITLLNKINSNWGIAGNAGISCYELGFSSQNMVRYIMDPHGGPNLRGKILPAESIDGNTILLNTPKLRENKIRLPNFNGFHLYDIILSIETIKSGLGVYIIPQLLCYHASSGNQIEFNKAFYNDAFIKYLQKKLINNHLKTINGSLPLPFSHLSEYNRIDIKNKSIENCLNTSKDASVAIVIRTRFTRINLLQRTVVTIKSFISNMGFKIFPRFSKIFSNWLQRYIHKRQIN